MARVTVEDCILRVPNRFDLVMYAGRRARDIGTGAPLTVDRDNDKNPVVALREIADETVQVDVLKDELIRGHQKYIEVEETEEELIELMQGEQEWVQPSGEIESLSELADAEEAGDDSDEDGDEDGLEAAGDEGAAAYEDAEIGDDD